MILKIKKSFIGAGSVKKGSSFYGRINVYEGYKFLWSEQSTIERLSVDDALSDGLKMKEDLILSNGGK